MFDKPRDSDDACRILLDLSRAFQAPAALSAGVETGLFAELARAPRRAAQLAKSLRCSLRGIQAISDALAAVGFLQKRGTRYALRAIWKPFLDPRSPRYVGGRFAHSRGSLVRWSKLVESVRSGKPVEDFYSAHASAHYFGALVPALFVFNEPDAREAMKQLGLGRLRSPYSVLDLASGSGVWGIAAAKANPRVRVTAVDFPKILPITKRFAAREKVAKQFRYLGGDLRKLDYGENRFDLVVFGLVCHQFSEKENVELFRKLRRSLRPGGQILIVEFAPYDDRSGPPFPVLFGLNMLLSTHDGDAFSRGEYCSWLDRAGFSRFRVVDRASGLTLIFARKRNG